MPAPEIASPSDGYADDPIPAPVWGWAARPRSPGATAQPWKIDGGSKPAMGPTACAQFVLDAEDRIITCRINDADLWYYHAAEWAGRPLRAMLVELNPDWGHALPERIHGSDTSIFLPNVAPAAPGLVLALHRLHCDPRTHVTLVPELAPPELLKRAGMSDLPPDPATFAKLFLRLRTIENRLDHYLSHLPGVVFNQRADLSFAFIGPGCEALIGLASQSLSKDSQALLRLIHPSDERGYYQELDRNLDATAPFSLVYRVLNPQTGTYLYLLDVRSPVRSASGMLLGYEGVWLDITRQKIAEHRLTTRAWKESLSTLTSGLLNDFSNVMTGIYSLSELYHNTLPPKHPLRDGLGLIKDNAAQAQHLVRKIIELNREASGEKTYVNLGKIIRDQLDVLKVVLPRGTQLIAPAIDGDWSVYIDETAFRQTLVNFALNARDALRGPGEIRISLRRLSAQELPLSGTVPPLVASAQPAIELIFADNGGGIAPAHVARVFDPFFTTKESNRGAGLGLYNARLFAESHGGQIAVRSALGRGAELVLVLPIADLSLAPEVPIRVKSTAAPLKRPRLLYLETGMSEDGSLVDALRHRDWEVRTVATPEHARRMMREDGVKLDAIMIRQPKPDAELRILLAEIHRDHPGLPVALALTAARPAELPASLTTQVDLLLPSDIRDRDAADSVAKLLRLP